jgi:hypothetical protein
MNPPMKVAATAHTSGTNHFQFRPHQSVGLLGGRGGGSLTARGGTGRLLAGGR